MGFHVKVDYIIMEQVFQHIIIIGGHFIKYTVII